MKALTGVRVVALEQAVAGPMCSRNLFDMGADVVKVERPGEGDFARGYDEHVLGWSSYAVWLNRGKRSIALDLKRPAGLAAFRKLLDESDVLVSNLGPGALQRLVNIDELSVESPRLIICEISGYGSSGPFGERKSYDLIVQGESGITWETGTPSGRAKAGVSVVDLAGATMATIKVLAGLMERERTGVGRREEVALFDVMADWMMPSIMAEAYGGGAPEPAGLHHAGITPYGAYETADKQLINVAVQNNEQWERFCRDVMEAPELLDDSRFRSNARRLAHRELLEQIVGDRIRELDGKELKRRLEVAKLPWGTVNDIAAVLSHPQLSARMRWQEVKLPSGDSAVVVSSPLLREQAAELVVPNVGQHTEEILLGLGYSEAEVAELKSEGVAA